MRSLAIHAALGVLTVVIFFRVNRYLYTHGWQGSRVTCNTLACPAAPPWGLIRDSEAAVVIPSLATDVRDGARRRRI